MPEVYLQLCVCIKWFAVKFVYLLLPPKWKSSLHYFSATPPLSKLKKDGGSTLMSTVSTFYELTIINCQWEIVPECCTIMRTSNFAVVILKE